MEWMYFCALLLVSEVSAVHFDVQPMAPAMPSVSSSLAPQMPDSRFVDVRLDVTSIVPTEFQGEVSETIVQFTTRNNFVQVADYWPKTELVSTIQGAMDVTEAYDRSREAAISGIGGYPGVGTAKGHAFFQDHVQLNVQYDQTPPMHLVTAAGTTDRRSGAYFKLRSSPQSSLEGARVFLLTLEVPKAWDGDLIEVKMVAYGRKESSMSKKPKIVGENRFLVALYNGQSPSPASIAMNFVQQQSNMKQTASRFSETVKRNIYPSPFHRLGNALDMYEPVVPKDFMDQWMFGKGWMQPPSKLPVDLRVAMLDFEDAKRQMELLVFGLQGPIDENSPTSIATASLPTPVR